MSELKPCPFCGGTAELERTTERFEYGTGGPYSVMEWGYYVYCTDCDGGTNVINVPPASEEEAIAQWNMRKLPHEVMSAIDTLCRVNEYHSSARLLRAWLRSEEPTP
jgi:Lar family restriction alleviation protein